MGRAALVSRSNAAAQVQAAKRARATVNRRELLSATSKESQLVSGPIRRPGRMLGQGLF
jgi:hypothetical protein